VSDSPRVSVIIPFLDPDPRFLAEAVESVLAQSFPAWELLLVNDGSGPEATREAEKWAARDPDRIQVFGHPGGGNRGVPATRNRGLERAKGEIVAFLDADDVWLPQRLETHLELLDGHPGAAMAFGASLYWRSWDGSDTPDFTPALGVPTRTLLSPRALLVHLISGAVAVPCPTSITCRTGAVRRVNGFVESFPWPTEDQAFYARMLLAEPAVATEEVLDRYRQHSRAMTSNPEPADEARWREGFLLWVRTYARDLGVRDPRLERTIRTELWALRHPRGARLLRGLRSVRRRLGAGRTVPIHLSEEGLS